MSLLLMQFPPRLVRDASVHFAMPLSPLALPTTTTTTDPVNAAEKRERKIIGGRLIMK